MKKYAGLKLALLAFIMFFSSPLFATSSTYKNNYDYLTLPESATQKLPTSNNNIVVMEFFNFGCPACYHYENAVETLEKQKPTYVEFYRIPVVFQPSWVLYAKAYFIAQNLNVEKTVGPLLFTAVQKDKKSFSTPEELANFFQAHGVDKTQFFSAYNSPKLEDQMKEAQSIVKAAMIYQVPTVMIDGTYRVDPSFTGNNKQRFVDIVNYLIQKQAIKKKLTTPTAAVAQKDDHSNTQ